MRWGFSVAALALTALLCSASAAAASDLTYFGGPVVHAPNAVVVEWGSGVDPALTSTTSGDPAMLSYFARQSGSTGDLGAVLAQYMDTTSANSSNAVAYAGDYRITPANTSTTLQDSDIQNELTSQIEAGHLPAPTGPNGLGTIYLLMFPKTITECLGNACDGQSGGFCAYHGSATLPDGDNALYAVLPSDEPGTGNYYGCGGASSYVENFTGYTAHEWAETINDPLVAQAGSWGPPLGWYDQVYNGEIADKCDSEALTTDGSFTVEPIWSNLDGGCMADESATYSAPTAAFSVAADPVPGQPAGFDASGSRDAAADHTSAAYAGASYTLGPGIARYDWSWGDGSQDGTGATPSHTFAAPGFYTVTLTVTDDMGFTAATSQTVQVGTPSPTASTGTADGISDQGATLRGAVDTYGQSATYQFLYGTSPTTLTSSTPAAAAPGGDSATQVEATIASGLAPSRTYYYQLVLQYGSQTTAGQLEQFSTTAAPPPPQTPVPGTGAATRLTTSDAALNGTLDAGGPTAVSFRFAYGSAANRLVHLTPLHWTPGGTTAVPVSASVAGLKAHTRYYFRLVAGLAGRVYPGATHLFTTRAPAPRARTGGAGVHGTRVSLGGSVNPRGFPVRYYFEFGARRRYGYSSAIGAAGSGRAARSVSAELSGLAPHTTYHYRLVAIGLGGIVVGSDRTFRTGARLTRAPRLGLAIDSRQRLDRALTRGLRVRFWCQAACAAQFDAVVALGGIARTVALPLTVARGSAPLSRAGVHDVTLRFSARSSRRLRSRRSLELVVSGFATAAGSTAGAPAEVEVTLRP